MKHTTRLFALSALCAASLAALHAVPLAGDTPVYASPDSSAPVVLTLGAGVEPSPATSASTVALPEGWQAIAITASVDVWVRDSDLNKELDVKSGATLRTEPNSDSPSAGTMTAGDVTELRGIQGKWVQMHVTKKTTGYIKPSGSLPAAAPAPAAPAVQPAPSTPAPPPPVQPVSSVPYAPNQTAAPSVQQPLSVASGNHPAQAARPPVTSAASASTQAVAPAAGGRTYEAKPADPNSAAISRTFEGTFASTRRALMPRRPYEFQLIAADGTRLAYLDLDKVTVTGQFERYLGRTVIVHGPLAPVPGTQDIVIKAETFQLR